jgi:hypothetical protein
MRRFKSLLRLAIDKGLGRNTRKQPAGQTHRRQSAPDFWETSPRPASCSRPAT